ncbi:glycosyltransferase [Pelagibacterium halotolerans]|uniref:glycosyltransferase n=1 Tax=Pelagibacterium halotolerans TaxID=531813 RepID=UPI0006816D6D|nr:glycosyltransferase family 2 protein [Pelagibacterium halotolerans]QJR19543.1 glycosyltransferase family 2 protein [Pelagibacterium halotolerans]SDZ88462.1 dolichol-phosphate mannosyltransferase [Pelagibacterium halotolerans]
MTDQENTSARTWVPPTLSVIVPTFNERENIAPLIEKLEAALAGITFEVIIVDDNSPDGTADLAKQIAAQKSHVRCIHRIGRRGLSSACIEGMASSAAQFVAVIDADHQHDEAILPEMLERARDGADIVVGSRYTGEGSSQDGFSASRQKGSQLATRLSGILTGKALSDPMSGFFLLRRSLFNQIVPRLSREGFKILLDIIATGNRQLGRKLVITEVPYTFRPRFAGESKMSALVVAQFLGLIVSQISRGILPTSFLLFSLVGASGVVVHLSVLTLAFEVFGFNFANSQLLATLVAMTTNYLLNNELTYADKKLRGRRFWTGLLSFYLVCSFGTLANVSVASVLFEAHIANFIIAGIAGAVMSVVFNYAVTRIFTWR